MQRVVVIHGNGDSSGSDNWSPWLKIELTKLGVKCETPNFPNPVLAKSDEWLPFLKETLKVDENTILIGHSSGAVAAMRYAEKNKIYGSILIGTYYSDLGYEDEKASGYFDAPWQWETIKNNQNWLIIFASTDDPFIRIEEPKYIRDKLDAQYHEFSDQGHFSGTSPGHQKLEFPELLDALKKKLNLS